MFLDGGRKGTHAYTWRTCSLHSERPPAGNRTREAMVLTTTPPCSMFVPHKYTSMSSTISLSEKCRWCSLQTNLSLSQHTFPSHELCIRLIRLVITEYNIIQYKSTGNSPLFQFKQKTDIFIFPSLPVSLLAVCYG